MARFPTIYNYSINRKLLEQRTRTMSDKEAFNRSQRTVHTPPAPIVPKQTRPVSEYWTKTDELCNMCEIKDEHTKLKCGKCKRWWHPKCVGRPMSFDDLSSGKWICKLCFEERPGVKKIDEVPRLSQPGMPQRGKILVKYQMQQDGQRQHEHATLALCGIWIAR